MEILERFTAKRKNLKLPALIFLALILSFNLNMKTAGSQPRTDPSYVRYQIEQLEQSISEKKNQLAAVNAELEEMQVQLEIATENFKEAQDRLQSARTRLIEVRLKAEQVQADLKSKQEIFSKRVKIIYKEGRIQYLAILLNSESLGDFLTRIHYMILITKSDTELIKSIRSKKVELEKIQQQLNEIIEEEQRALYELEVRKLAIQSELQKLENYKRSLSQETQMLLAQLEDLMLLQQNLYKSYYNVIPEAFGINVEPGSVVDTALRYLGVPYVWGGEDPEIGFDCSGLVRYVFLQHGIELPHYSGYQFKYGKPVEKEELIPGDLVFFGNPIHHVGIYVGNGYFIHAPRTGDFVKLTPLESRRDYAGARRIIGYVMPTRTPAN